MSLKALVHRNLADVNAAVINSFDSYLASLIYDCTDRPGDKRKRSVTLTLHLTPAPEQSGTIDQVDVQMVVTSKMPAVQTGDVKMGLRGNRQLVFNPDALENVDQATIPMPDDQDR